MFVFFTLSFFPLHISLITNEDRLSEFAWPVPLFVLVTIHHKYVWTFIGLSYIFFHKSSFVFQRKYVLLPLAELEGNLYFIILNAFSPHSVQSAPLDCCFLSSVWLFTISLLRVSARLMQSFLVY